MVNHKRTNYRPSAVARGLAAADWSEQCDPGPVPEVVEPETFGKVTTVAAGRIAVHITEDVGRTGMTGLTLETSFGDSITVALSGPTVDAVVAALVAANPIGGARDA